MIRTRWALATLLATCLLAACSDDDPKPDIADPTAVGVEFVGDGESFSDGHGRRPHWVPRRRFRPGLTLE